MFAIQQQYRAAAPCLSFIGRTANPTPCRMQKQFMDIPSFFVFSLRCYDTCLIAGMIENEMSLGVVCLEARSVCPCGEHEKKTCWWHLLLYLLLEVCGTAAAAQKTFLFRDVFFFFLARRQVRDGAMHL